MEKPDYTTKIGAYLVIQITGDVRAYIAEVTNVDPLQMKVEEVGPYAHLKRDDFIVQERATAQLQRDHLSGSCAFLEAEQRAGRKVFSGLRSLGVEDGWLHEILPGVKS